jgi:hypothetical protein
VLQESGWVDPEGCEPEVPTADADAEAFSKVSMKAEVEQMLAGGGADDTSQKLPSSLLEIMNGTGEKFNAMFRLIVKLRCGHGGVDARWVTNHRKSRVAGRNLNWHQYLGLL